MSNAFVPMNENEALALAKGISASSFAKVVGYRILELENGQEYWVIDCEFTKKKKGVKSFAINSSWLWPKFCKAAGVKQ